MIRQFIRPMLVLTALLCSCFLSNAQTNVDFNAYRAKMGGEKDARLVVKSILNEYKDTENLTIAFQDEKYDFYPDSAELSGKSDGFPIKDRKGLTIEGNGALFIFHGIMGISMITDSEDITMRNFTVDWDRTIMSQVEIVDMTDDYFDVHIDAKEYPYHVVDERLCFIGEGWDRPIMSMFQNVYDPNGEILYKTSDGTIGGGFDKAPVEDLGQNIVRFHFHAKTKLPKGSILVLTSGHYASHGIGAGRCSNLKYENLTIYHSMGAGITGHHCENVTETNVKIIPNRAKGRVFSTEADAQHYSNCKGLVWLNGCESNGQSDDFINVHGRYYNVSGVTGPKSIALIGGHWKNGTVDFAPGETVAFLKPDSGQREYMLTVDKVTDTELIFKEELPAEVDTTFYVENYTWTASFLFENCTVPKGNRARGILFTTPKPVIIRNNYFHSAGTAILMEGDINFWYEAGALGDVEIYGNVFDNCFTSGWGSGVITITPSHRPVDADAPAYHRNIKIHNNEFRVFDNRIMRACSVDGLKFTRNKIIKTYDYEPLSNSKDAFIFEGCRNVVIKGNKFDKSYEGSGISTTLMNLDEVKAPKSFTVYQKQ